MARHEKPTGPDDEPTRVLNLGQLAGPPTAWYLKPAALVSWGVLISLPIGLIVFGIVTLFTDNSIGSPVTTTTTTTTTTTATAGTTPTTAASPTTTTSPTPGKSPTSQVPETSQVPATTPAPGAATTTTAAPQPPKTAEPPPGR